MPSSLNFRAVVPMVHLMNAIAQVSAAPVSGPKLDNRRVAAAIIDLLIVSVGAVAILVAGNSLSGDRQSALSAVILGWALYYFFALESGDGQTLGKKVMKLRVVRADGRPAGMGEIAVRTILRVIDNYLVGLIVMLATGERRQRIGDLAAGTIVVDASGPAVADPAPAADAEVAEHEADEPEAEAAAEQEPASTSTITLPARPAPPATLADLGEPEDGADEEPAEEQELPSAASPAIEELAQDVAAAHSEPEAGAVEDEPIADVAVEDEPVADVAIDEESRVDEEPVADIAIDEEPVADVAIDEEPVVEEPVVPVPVVSAEPVAEEPVAEDSDVEEPVAEEPVVVIESDAVDAEDVAAEPQDDGPVVVKSVQTVSAMDLVMGAAEERAAEDASEESSHDAGDPASA
jgi:uncharacterized RDD family membrane protein YckC